MANVIRLKRASGSDPAASDLVSGEPAVRTDTGELFFKKDDGSVAKVSGAGGGPDFKYLALRNAANNGAASYPNADFTLVTSGTTTALTPTAANTLLVSVNGVIQKPNTGTSTPSSGFALSGSTIKFGANISTAPDFILYQESGGIGEPSDDTVSEVKLKVSNSPVNGYFLSAQSGNTGGLTWAAPVATSCTGNSATATALATARAINGVNFDGTAAITVTAAAGTLSGNTLNSSVVTSSLTSLGDLTSLTVTGDLVVDTSTLKVDSSNNRVGIGTASPSTVLHIADGTEPGIRIQDTNNVNSDFKIYSPDGDNALRIYHQNTSSDLFHISSSGNVGIGTTSPTRQLDINNSSHAVLALTSTTQSSLFFADDDTNIGQISYVHGTNHMYFRVNDAERMRIDSSGDVVIGSSTNGGSNRLYVVDSHTDAFVNPTDSILRIENADTSGTTGQASISFTSKTSGSNADSAIVSQAEDASGNCRLEFWTDTSNGMSEKMAITSSGTIKLNQADSMITTNADTSRLRFFGGSTNSVSNGAVLSLNGINHSAGNYADLAAATGGHIQFRTGTTERMRISSDGYVYAIGQAGSYISNTGLYHQFINTGNGRWTMQIKQEHHNGMNTQLLVNSQTNIEAFQIYSTGNNTTRFRVLNNGNCANANNSFGSLSDVKLKENIVDANSQWDDVKAVKVRNFNFKNDKDTKLLGVVAQEVETVSSGLVFDTIDRDPDDSTKEIGTTKNVKYSILYMKAFKALQEAMAKIETLETKVAALEAK